MANKAIQIKDGNDNLLPITGTISAHYTPTITSGTGFTYDAVSVVYKVTSDFLFLSGRFRVTNHGSTNAQINISYPPGITTIAGVGAYGHVHINNATNTSGLSIRPTNDGTSCFIQSGAGDTTVAQLVPNGDYVIFEAMIPLR